MQLGMTGLGRMEATIPELKQVPPGISKTSVDNLVKEKAVGATSLTEQKGEATVWLMVPA